MDNSKKIIYFSVELGVDGLCKDMVVHDNNSQPYFVIGATSRFGSLEGGYRAKCINRSPKNDIVLLLGKLGTNVTLAYIPSEETHDEMR